MSRKTNEELYVPFKKEEPEKKGYEKFAEEHGAPPLKKLFMTALMTLGSCAVVILILIVTGLSLTTVETDSGVEIRYFGWIHHGVPTLGTMHTSNGTGAQVGGGSVVYSDGSVYVGGMKDLKKEGQGRLVFADGTTYTGYFKDDLYDGFGTLVFADGTNYEGSFAGGSYHGSGVLVQSNGNRYEGEFENGERSGNGVMTYYDGSKFEGSFKNDMRDTGKYTWKSGESITGVFVNNMPDPAGFISYTDADEDTYYVTIRDGIIVRRVSYIKDETAEKEDETANETENTDTPEVFG